jgi:putative transposase
VERLQEQIDRPPLPDDELVAKIKAVIAELPTYGYRRVHAILKRQALAAGLKPPNHKRVYRVMKVHSLLLDRHVGDVKRRHDGRIAVDERNRRWVLRRLRDRLRQWRESASRLRAGLL